MAKSFITLRRSNVIMWTFYITDGLFHFIREPSPMVVDKNLKSHKFFYNGIGNNPCDYYTKYYSKFQTERLLVLFSFIMFILWLLFLSVAVYFYDYIHWFSFYITYSPTHHLSAATEFQQI